MSRAPAGVVFIATVVFSLGVLFTAPRDVLSAGWEWIESAHVQKIIVEGGGPWLIDIRNPRSYEAEHIEGSVNIIAMDLANKSLPPGGTLVLVDDSLGQRSARAAADVLARKGHEKVYVLKGGMASWEAEGRLLVVQERLVRGVTLAEIQGALAEKVPVRVFDMSTGDKGATSLPIGGEAVGGENIAAKLQSLEKQLAPEVKSGLLGELNYPEPVVLIFPAAEDAVGLIHKLRRHVNADLRYLIGGSEIFTARDFKNLTVNEKCPTCP